MATTVEAPRAPAAGADLLRLPAARGPLSSLLLACLLGSRPTRDLVEMPSDVVAGADPYGEDLQLALYLAYELHYRAIAGVDPELEWDPDLLAFRARLERRYLAALRADVTGGDDVEAGLAPLLVNPRSGRGVSWHLSGPSGTLAQLREYLVHRSAYHLKEGDPQTWVVPRLQGHAKAAFMAVQHDEYGAGRGERMHSQLFAEAMVGAGLDSGYGAYLDRIPAVSLALVSLQSLCGLHRSLRGAAVGQLAVIEITSPPGSARISAAFAQLGAGAAGQRFYDEHVEADAVHEQVLRRGLIADLLDREPELAGDVVFGVQASLLLEDRLGEHLLGSWERGESSLLRPLTI